MSVLVEIWRCWNLVIGILLIPVHGSFTNCKWNITIKVSDWYIQKGSRMSYLLIRWRRKTGLFDTFWRIFWDFFRCSSYLSIWQQGRGHRLWEAEWDCFKRKPVAASTESILTSQYSMPIYCLHNTANIGDAIAMCFFSAGKIYRLNYLEHWRLCLSFCHDQNCRFLFTVS